MPNPGGINNFNRFAPEPAYGEKLQQDALERSAPVPANPAMNAPRRAQKAASRPQASRQQAAPQAPPAPAPSPEFVAAQEWNSLAQIPGASDLVKYYAAKAQRG